MSGKGLCHVILPQSCYGTVRQIIRAENELITLVENNMTIVHELKSFLNGRNTVFHIPIDLSNTSPFQHDVLRATCSIPYGETRTYAWIAQEIGHPKAVRAVGQALAHNPVPIVVPCHRVIASNGSLHGFRGGLDLKQRLITMEQSLLNNPL